MSASKEGPQPLVPAYAERRENCPRYRFAGGVWIILADAARTAGHIANLEAIYGEGGGLPYLIRQREAEFAYVLTGRVRILIGDAEETVAHPGAMVYVPAGVGRQFIADVEGTRIYYGWVPAGSEELIRRTGVVTTELSSPFVNEPFDVETAAEFGIFAAAATRSGPSVHK